MSADHIPPTPADATTTALEAMIARDFPGFRTTRGRNDEGGLYLLVDTPWKRREGAAFLISLGDRGMVVTDNLNTAMGAQRADAICADVDGVGRAMRAVLENHVIGPKPAA